MPRFSWTSARVAEALGVPAAGHELRTYSGISTDTRTLRTGELFVALRGQHFDGLEFVARAAQSGAPGAVVERRPQGVPDDFELFVVDDALRALGQLAAVRRHALDPTVVAITGTSGKTTTRELTVAALGDRAYASPGNYNNLVGLPLSILGAPEDSDIWVLELASNQLGEIEQLARIAEPDCAVITSVSEGHLEGLLDLQGVMEEKLALLSSLRAGGRALVCDEPAELARQARQRFPDVRTVGLSGEADVRPESWSVSADGIAWRWSGVDFRLTGYGTHLIRDALFALAVVELFGVDARQAAKRLRLVKPLPMRGELRQLAEVTLLVDCYNANPASFRAALDSLSALAAGRRRAVLAGTMLELGEQSQALHERVARSIAEEGIELIAATGEFTAAFAGLADELGERLIRARELDVAYRELAARLRGDEVVLIKASRAMKFERAVPLFERDYGGKGQLRISGTHA